MIRPIYPPNFDNSCTITADNAPSKRRVNACQRCYDILVRFQQILLVVGDERHPLGCTIGIACHSWRVRPCLNVGRGRSCTRASDAEIKFRKAQHAKREDYLYVGLSNSESRPLNTVVLSSLLKSHSRTLRSSDPLIINPRPDERLTELKSLVASVESTRWPD